MNTPLTTTVIIVIILNYLNIILKYFILILNFAILFPLLKLVFIYKFKKNNKFLRQYIVLLYCIKIYQIINRLYCLI